MTKTPSQQEMLLREAARLVIKLNENPDDPDALAARDAFLQRGQVERDAFARTVRTVSIGQRRPPPKKGLVVAFFLAAAAAAYAGYEPTRIALLADWRSSTSTTEIVLDSGDRVYMDASSAIGDGTEGARRTVTLLQGGGFFDVDTSNRPFSVKVGALTATALGTTFEVTLLDGDVFVSVAEGLVEVRVEETAWQLREGERLKWSEGRLAEVTPVSTEDIAGWRADRFATNGMTFAQVIEAIDRRLPGRIIILDRALAGSEMTGVLDLTHPETALELALSARQASLVTKTPLVTIIRSAN